MVFAKVSEAFRSDLARGVKRACTAEEAIERSAFLWRISELGVSYDGIAAISAISLDIEKGSVTAIIGPSGCGKTSFLYCLNRLSLLIPRCCVSGRILLHTKDMLADGVSVAELRRRIGLVFQKPNPFPMSIRRNLELPLKEHGIHHKGRIDELIEDSLRAVGLWSEVRDRLKSSALNLSGGQQQRLCIARALILKPEALLMDEPCSALDPLATARIEELIGELKHRYTLVVVTHNLAQARRIASHIAFFWKSDGGGSLIEAGTAYNFFEAPRTDLGRAYLRNAKL